MASLPLGQVANVSGEAGFTHGAGDGNNREHVLVSSVRDLRDTCARLGLLNTGSKAILQQRLCLYYASAPPPLRSGADAPLMSLSPDAIGLGSKTPTSRSTGSPPRTVFRYRSPSHPSGSVPPASAAPAVAGPLSGTLGGEGIGAPTMQTDMAAARGDVAAPAATRGVAPGRRERLVPPPTQFFHDLAARKTQPPSKASGTICNAHLPAFLSAMRSQEEELKGEMSRVHWRWLVDFRERASAPRGGGRRQHENMLDVFRRQNVSFTSAMLPAGDFMLCVELSSEEADAMQASGLAATTKASAIVSSDPTAPEGAAPVLSHACSLIVERKTAADLDASVKGTRYTEQRRLLAASPFRLVIWLIEGTDVASGGGSSFFCGGQRRCRGGGGLESNTQPGCRGSSPTTASPAERARQRVDSACASLGLHGEGWLVVRTRDTTESVQFLKLLATHVARQLASYRLHIRCASATDGVVLTGHPHSAAFEDAAQYSYPQRIGRAVGGDASLGRFGCRISCGDASRTCLSAAVALLQLAPTKACLQSVAALQRHLRAKTAFPRMLMCVRGCSAALASLLSSKYGTLLRFWRELRQRGQEACDADPDIQRLTTAQKKVYVLLTEFLLAKDYF
ncbi:hypothetical protein JKF63_05636 [Porcisia hertigi]|uniref:Crossover junction endonuclease MUS81 n=1 Tax=Porcisia hertigi TaxID=2761500 RepID=A0A836LB07_9TRYP|nr:hypothetical protein JKF63_05636 [Porcisia hertigi]